MTADATEAKATKGETEARAKRFLPFSAGTRDCVGQSLARMNYTTTVAMLLAHFKFELNPEVGTDVGCHQCCSIVAAYSISVLHNTACLDTTNALTGWRTSVIDKGP